MESVFYRALLLHVVHSYFILKSRFSHALLNTHVSCSTKRSELTWQKRVRTIENFFASNRSQTESEKNDTEDEQCNDQEVTDEDQRKPKKSQTFQKTLLRDHTLLCYEKAAMFCYFCWKSNKTNPFASASELLMFGLEPTEELVDVRLPVVMKGVAVFKEMPKWDSAVKHFWSKKHMT